MLSIETEARVAKLFINLAEGEKSVEINRQVLADQIDFDPYTAFKRIDSRLKNSIDEFDIVDFLKVNSIYCTYNEARFIIYFYDQTNKGYLNYAEFLNLVLSDFNYSLKRIARERAGYPYRHTVPYDVEYSLSKVFERELDVVRSTESILNDIKARYDFNVYDLYASIQTYSYLNGDR